MVNLAQSSCRPIVLPTDYRQNNLVIIILVAAAALSCIVGTAAYLYNRQRKIREYKLQKAQEASNIKLNTPP